MNTMKYDLETMLYDWYVCELDSYGDAIDTHTGDDLKELLSYIDPQKPHTVELRKRLYNFTAGEDQYALGTSEGLPEVFEDGSRVPKRFREYYNKVVGE